jgi:LPS export ABC transporter protein LptC
VGKYTKRITLLKAATLVAAFLVSCQPDKSVADLEEHNRQMDSLQIERATDVAIVYTDSAELRAKIMAPVLNRNPEKKNPYVEMPNGIKAEFYGPDETLQSTLTANYAINYEKKDVVEIRDSVRVLNKNDEEIKSNELIWNKKDRKVYSDKPVRVRIRDEKIIKAQGFESDESFLRYSFKKVTGIVYLKEDPKTEEKEE